MPREKMSDEERAAKQRARADAIKEKRELRKREIRAEILTLASQIPPHVRTGGVVAVRAWKDALDAAVEKAELSRVSVDRLQDVATKLKDHVAPA